jgi:hypothetical protein
MPPDRDLRLSLGNPVSRGLHFPTLVDCIVDAKKYGYVEPEEGWRPPIPV